MLGFLEKDEQGRRAREEARIRFQAEIAVQKELKASLFEQQKLDEMRALEEGKRREDFKNRVIEEARRKLLQEHASKLRGYLPRGVITSNADLDLIKAFDRNNDGKLEPEEMELAMAAFNAFDAGANKKSSAPIAQQQQQQQQQPQAARRGASSIQLGGDSFDDPSARRRK
jgi:hypothetical protein